MDTIKIKDFLPIYPEIYNNDNFYEAVYRKLEFYDEKLPRIEELKQEKGFLFRIQKIIARYLSSHTLYKGILILHYMGTGKSCTAVAAAEQIRYEDTFKFTGVIYLAPGRGLLDNFAQEITLKCTDGRYIPERFEDAKTIREKMRLIRASIKPFYSLITYRRFAKGVMRMKRQGNTLEEIYKRVIERFSNKIFILDEVHNLRPKLNATQDEKTTYEEIKNVCRLVKNSKIILMSGTPMKDTPDEIASILNLILPNELPTGQQFTREYLTETHGVLDINKDKVNDLKSYFKGHVSYLKAMESDVKKEYIGQSNVGKLKYFKVDLDIMSPFQSQIYNQAFNTDTSEKGIYTNSRQACLFVFPDGSYGSKGFKKNVIETKHTGMRQDPRTGKYPITYSYKLQRDVIQALKGSNMEETLNNIDKHSSKYGKIIRQILNATDKCVLVYSEFVSGSGSIIFSKLLELVGFSNATGGEQNEGLRYAILTNKTASSMKIAKIQNRFNRPDNLYGKYIKVIIGSAVITEGFSFRNVQEEHIITPFWNYTPLEQFLTRGLRVDSHRDLLETGVEPIVRMYQHASVSSNENIDNSIDYIMYNIAEKKDVSIKHMERVIQESAFDCALTYERNRVYNALDGSRECHYKVCDYKCDGVEPLSLSQNELDESTFKLYYSSPNVHNIMNRIVKLFQTSYSLSLQYIQSQLNTYSLFEIITALRRIIRESVIIYNQYGFPSFLKEDRDIYYLVDSLSVSGNLPVVFYTENPISKHVFEFTDELNALFNSNIPNMVSILSSVNDNEFENMIKKLPENVKEMFIEASIISRNRNIQVNRIFRDRILSHFSNYIHEFNGIWLSSYQYDSNNILRCLDRSFGNFWTNCNEEYYNMYKQSLQDIKTDIENNPYGFYGIYDRKKDVFCIRDLRGDTKRNGDDKRKITTGKACKSWKIPELIVIATAIKLDYNRDICGSMDKNALYNSLLETKAQVIYDTQNVNDISHEELCRAYYWVKQRQADLCGAIMNWFENNNLLVYGNCGRKVKD